MADNSQLGRARAEARFKAAAQKKSAADDRNDERIAAEHVRDGETAKLKAQRLARDETDREAAEAARKAIAEALKRKRS